MDTRTPLITERKSAPHTPGADDVRADFRRDPVGQVVRFATVGLFGIVAVYAIGEAQPVLFPLLLAILLAILLSGTVSRLERFGAPRALAAALVVAGLLAVSAGGVAILTEPAKAWLQRAPTTIAQLERKLRGFKHSVEDIRQTAKKVGEVASVSDDGKNAQKVEVSAQPAFPDRVMAAIPGVAIGAASTLALLYLLLASGDHFFRKVVRCMGSFSDKRKVVRIARTAQTEFAGYLATITRINVSLAIATTLAMYLLGMPNPYLWGVLAGVLNFVPYIGPAVSLVVIAIASLISFDQIGAALLPPAVFLLLTIVEGQIIAPMVIGRRFTLHPVLVFVAMLIGGYAWGIGGTVIAVPTLMAIKIVCDHVEALGPVGEFMSGRHEPVPAFARVAATVRARRARRESERDAVELVLPAAFRASRPLGGKVSERGATVRDEH